MTTIQMAGGYGVTVNPVGHCVDSGGQVFITGGQPILEPQTVTEIRNAIDRKIDERMAEFVRESIHGMELGLADLEAGRVITLEELDELMGLK